MVCFKCVPFTFKSYLLKYYYHWLDRPDNVIMDYKIPVKKKFAYVPTAVNKKEINVE